MSEEKKYQILWNTMARKWEIYPRVTFKDDDCNPVYTNYWAAWAVYVKFWDLDWEKGSKIFNAALTSRNQLQNK